MESIATGENAHSVAADSTNGAIFVVLLIGVIVIVAALTFFPADALGPIVEHLAMMQGKLY